MPWAELCEILVAKPIREMVERERQMKNDAVMNKIAELFELIKGNTNDPVSISDNIQHPVDFMSSYTDTLTGFTGKATAVGYNAVDSTVVLLSTSKDGKPVSHYINLRRLVPTDDARLDLQAPVPKLPITFFREYKDEVSGFVGDAAAVIFSSNKCVQVILATGTHNSIEEHVFDIQNLKPTEEDVEDHNMTSDTNPGAPSSVISSSTF